jgi:hypothetical protein
MNKEMEFLGEGPYHKVGFKGLGWLALKPGLWWGRKGIAFPPRRKRARACALIRTRSARSGLEAILAVKRPLAFNVVHKQNIKVLSSNLLTALAKNFFFLSFSSHYYEGSVLLDL